MNNLLFKSTQISIVFFICFLIFTPINAKATNGEANENNWYEDFTYNLDENAGTIKLSRYNGNNENLVIPVRAVIDGKTYSTIIVNLSSQNRNVIKKLSFENGVKLVNGIKFGNIDTLEEIDFTGVDTSEMTDMSYMFESCYNIKNLDLSMFDTRNVTTMEYMFSDCMALESVDLTSFDTSKVTLIRRMFSRCYHLESLDLSNLNFQSIKRNDSNNNTMFDEMQWLATLKTPINVPADSRISLPTGTNYCYSYVDESGEKITYLPYGDASSVSKVITLKNESVLPGYIYHVDSTNKKIDLFGYNGNAQTITIPRYVTIDGESYSVNISSCQILNAKEVHFEPGVTISGSFFGSEFEKIDLTGIIGFTIANGDALFSNCRNLKQVIWGNTFDITGNNRISGWQWLFTDARSLKEIDLSRFSPRTVEHIYQAFKGCYSLEKLNLSSWDMSAIQTDAIMCDWGLDTCQNLKYIYCPKNLPANVSIQLPGIFFDQNNNMYFQLPTGLSESILIVSEKIADEVDGFNDNSNDTTWQNAFRYTKEEYLELELHEYIGNKNANICIMPEAIIAGRTRTTFIKEIKIRTTGTVSFGEGFRLSGSTIFKNSSFSTIDFTGVKAGSIRGNSDMLKGCKGITKIIAPVGLSANADVVLPYTFVDTDDNEYDSLPTGLSTTKILLVKNAEDAVVPEEPEEIEQIGGTSGTEGGNTEGGNTEGGQGGSQSGNQSGDEEQSGSQPDGQTSEEASDVDTPKVGETTSYSNAVYEISGEGTVTYKQAQNKKKKKVTIPAKISISGESYTVTSIDKNAFKGNKKLTSIVIPSSVVRIEAKAFYGCKNLKKIVINANSNLTIGKNAFKNLHPDCVIQVKGVGGKTKDKIVRAIKKQTNATVK
ncbi:surface protein [Butyrivibrio sp. ob235]|uniref:leucine-rich repeat protein n=1 Tax=Butyrivibrio sp. ob235 TaxID=1761780 RepID=UPI0008B671D2|nr:leucine-rich repeat protein [Butyrivibrio sp. ob235]SEL36640.1 surface protein [Butyrivibrio sp. ob235]